MYLLYLADKKAAENLARRDFTFTISDKDLFAFPASFTLFLRKLVFTLPLPPRKQIHFMPYPWDPCGYMLNHWKVCGMDSNRSLAFNIANHADAVHSPLSPCFLAFSAFSALAVSAWPAWTTSMLDCICNIFYVSKVGNIRPLWGAWVASMGVRCDWRRQFVFMISKRNWYDWSVRLKGAFDTKRLEAWKRLMHAWLNETASSNDEVNLSLLNSYHKE